MAHGKLEIDHVFVFTAPEATQEIERLNAAGFVQSNRRRHVGQGTANACYCFDNAYLELLWPVDVAELAAPAVSRTRLGERSRWHETGASPFGLAVRPKDGGTLPFVTWPYEAPFLPAGRSLPVAVASDDPAQPMLFQSPGTARPDQWANGRAGNRQVAVGLTEVTSVELAFPVGIEPADAFKRLADDGVIDVKQRAAEPSMTLIISRPDGGLPCALSLPDCRMVG
ncbi:MAG: VOC family protein [Pseudomonadota bacterium]